MQACAAAVSNIEVAAALGVSRPTVGKWRARFVERRLQGLVDEQRSGAPRTITDEQVEQVVVETLEQTRRRDAPVADLDGRALGVKQVDRGPDLEGARRNSTCT